VRGDGQNHAAIVTGETTACVVHCFSPCTSAIKGYRNGLRLIPPPPAGLLKKKNGDVISPDAPGLRLTIALVEAAAAVPLGDAKPGASASLN